MIHQAAIVSPGARIGSDVEIGPFSIVEDNVEIGDGTWIGPHVVIRSHTSVGRKNKIYQFSSIGEAPQHQGYQGEPTRLEIGDGNTIREYCQINRGTPDGLGMTSIGDHNLLMAYAHIAHDCVLGNHTIFANGSSLAGHVEVGDYAILGGFTLIHQFCNVGAHCITGGGSVFFKDVPPFMVGAGYSGKPYGINTKGLRRRDFDRETISLLRQAYRLLYRSDLNLKTAIDEIEKLDPANVSLQTLTAFLRNTQRGIIR
ncbi:MAG: acyl-ACP--UDP-N-acetylglucosamine O-acyltransferase [Pseudomonadota bacterium]|nr:acyl-ACP--UDP-N-acetylglucosamine O-acyltransferase [Pseudomonadota bacterium]